MKRPEMNRREFNTLAAAAFGGVVAGTVAGCGKTGGKSESKTEDGSKVAVKEKHLCRGLNTCEGKGADGKNKCKGQGSCATVKHATCGGNNECKGFGGCHGTAGKNECKGKGGCEIPLQDKTWKLLKAEFDKKHNIVSQTKTPAKTAPKTTPKTT